MKIIDVTPDNVLQKTLFCVKDVKNPGFAKKQLWFNERYKEGLRLKMLKDDNDKLIAFIEYIPAEYAWRPVEAGNFMFIHCMFVYANKDKGKGNASLLIKACEEDAKSRNMSGVAVMTSKGTWITDKRIFLKNNYTEADKLERFELMVKKFDDKAPDPKLIDWRENQSKYKGWHLMYSDQCPWHEKSALIIQETAKEQGIDLNVSKINTTEEAKEAPSGFAVFNLLHDGKLLSDHYISNTRFLNILKKEL